MSIKARGFLYRIRTPYTGLLAVFELDVLGAMLSNGH